MGSQSHPRPSAAAPAASRRMLGLGLIVVTFGAGFLAARGSAVVPQARSGTDAPERERYEAHLTTLRADLARLETRLAHRDDAVERRVGEVQRAVAQVESTVLARVGSEIERSLDANPDLRAARDAVERLEREEEAGERVIARCAPSVCLIQGAYGFGCQEGGEWRFLRETIPRPQDEPPADESRIPLSLDGDGPVFRVEFTGTGFLVGADLVLTNRHIAEPWWRSDAARPLVEEGYEPRFLYLRVYFPCLAHGLACDAADAKVSEDADLALLRLPAGADLPPPLPLARAQDIAVGRSVVLLGYPSGLSALLARSEEGFLEELTGRGPFDPLCVLDALAQRGLIRPLPTRGHISDIVGDKLLFDAPTAVGGSGGPLLDLEGRVVAVNYGILTSFSGANFGVPVRYAEPLLAPGGARRD